MWDLFFGMMLPSGNDAAQLVAEVCGSLIKYYGDKKVDPAKIYDPEQLENITNNLSSNVVIYLK